MAKTRSKGWQLVGRGQPSEVAPNNGRTVRPLTCREITENMSAADAEWHVQHNKKNWEAAFEEQERRRQSKNHIAKTRIELAWNGHSTPQEEAAIRAGQSWASRTPSFPRTLEAATLMCEYMKRESLDAGCHRVIQQGIQRAGRSRQNYAAALRIGRTVPPKAVPPLIASQQAKAAATATHFEQAASATAASGSTKFVDYEPEQRGPLYANTTKASFRNLLKNLSADEYLEKMQDPQFRAAVDKLEEK